jgi:hypothetical protein
MSASGERRVERFRFAQCMWRYNSIFFEKKTPTCVCWRTIPAWGCGGSYLAKPKRGIKPLTSSRFLLCFTRILHTLKSTSQGMRMWCLRAPFCEQFRNRIGSLHSASKACISRKNFPSVPHVVRNLDVILMSKNCYDIYFHSTSQPSAK